MTLGSVVLSDHLTLGLENRAFREGLVGEDHFTLSEFASPKIMSASVAEEQVADMICLYDEVWSEERRFHLNTLNRVAGATLVRPRPSLIRALNFHFDHPALSRQEWADKLSGRTEFELLREQAAAEAHLLMRRDIDWYLADAMACFESEAPRWTETSLYDLDVGHRPIAEFLRQNIFWLVDFFDNWFSYGDYGHFIDADYLESAEVPRHLVRQFDQLSRSLRFDSYFRHLQESYTSLYENGFVGRLEGLEVAYDRAPDRRSHSAVAPDVASLSRVIRINLSDVAEFFPLPRTLEEALEFRAHPKVQAFRQVLSQWLCSVADDHALEAKIRRELTLANRDLTRLKSWRHLKERPLFFGVKTALSVVPFLGYVTTTFDVIDYFYERRAKERSAWIVTPSARLA